MMRKRAPLVLLAFLYFVFFVTLVRTADQLPELVASHFNARGNPDDWMERSNYLLFTIGLAIFLPGLVVGLCYGLRFLPDSAINLPRREYWLAAERRQETYDYLFKQSLWFGCLAVAFVIAIHFTVIRANAHFPARLSTPLLLAVAGSFVAGVVTWSLHLMWRFLRGGPATRG